MIPAFRKLVEGLKVLPGVGEKTAVRMATDILQLNDARAQRFMQAVEHARKSIHACERCYGYAEADLCNICSSTRQNPDKLCVVVTPLDVWNLDATGKLGGYFHVLGAVLSPLDGIGPSDIHMESLIGRLQEGQFNEVLFALPATPEAEATAQIIKQSVGREEIVYSHLAYGIPVGGTLEFLDEQTLSFAIENRRTY